MHFCSRGVRLHEGLKNANTLNASVPPRAFHVSLHLTPYITQALVTQAKIGAPPRPKPGLGTHPLGIPFKIPVPELRVSSIRQNLYL